MPNISPLSLLVSEKKIFKDLVTWLPWQPDQCMESHSFSNSVLASCQDHFYEVWLKSDHWLLSSCRLKKFTHTAHRTTPFTAPSQYLTWHFVPGELKKGHNSVKMQFRVMALGQSVAPVMVKVCAKFQKDYLNHKVRGKVKVLQAGWSGGSVVTRWTVIPKVPGSKPGSDGNL